VPNANVPNATAANARSAFGTGIQRQAFVSNIGHQPSQSVVGLRRPEYSSICWVRSIG
jgi:hypothetical protein